MTVQKNQKAKKMCVTILGCGTSVGSPMIGKQSDPMFKNPKNHRMRASCLVEPFGRSGPAILIDTSPDLRRQAINFFPAKPRLDAVLVTHTHADHIHGLDDIRPFNHYQRASIPFYSEEFAAMEIRNRFDYIFDPIQIGGGLPQLTLNEVNPNRSFQLKHAQDPRLKKLKVTPLPVDHGKFLVLGYRIANFAYIVDCHQIPEKTIKKLSGLDVLVLDCLREEPHSTHLSIEQAISYAQRINAKRTIFTHMTSFIEYESFRKSLPARMSPAYDGLRFYTPS